MPPRDLEGENRRLREQLAAQQRLLEEQGAHNRRLERRIDELLEELRRLNRRLEELGRAGKRQATPFARRERKGKRKKPGRKRGHPASYRTRPDHVDREARALLRWCPGCRGSVHADREHEQFVIDLPPVRPHVTRIVTESGWCGRCRCRVRSQHPAQVSVAGGAAAVAVGPRALGLAAEMKHRLGVPYRDVAALFSAYFGLRITSSALVQASTRLARKGKPSYEAIKTAIRGSPVVHTDDTGWRVDTESAWLWVFTTPEATLYSIEDRRGHGVVTDILGDDFEGILVSDGLPALDSLTTYRRAQCLAHVLRRASEMADEQTRGSVRFPLAVKRLIKDVLKALEERSKLSGEVWSKRVTELETQLDLLLASDIKHPANLRLANHLRKHRDQLLVCLRDPAVPATNNLAERELRGAVILRKTGGCNRAATGASAHAVLATAAQTAHRHDANLADLVTAWLTPRRAQKLPPRLAQITALTN